MDILYYDTLRSKLGDLFVVASDKGIVYIGTPDASFEEVEVWAKKPFKNYTFEESSEKVAQYIEQLEDYFKGELREFDLPIHVKGTPFQLAVWDALKELPYGTTTSYSGIAEMIGNPKAVRAVGAAIGANPILAIIPCHRVIGKNGKMTGFRSGIPMKEFLLQLERK
ncbi:methylated-DNA--[protein]-cysteine S-methyltransferase [Lysinibacillus sp. NPDC097287]|uniref:methylated-DNA--[protein]-cysteine S-methyltransferase n=1 Tax=Lysinibacillus sp. NPDC097287 TaxID=3364144 RepID=UPI0037FA90B6